MMIKDNPFFYPERISKYFLERELVPLAPDAYVDLLGDYLAEYFQTIMDILLPQRVAVLCGYYAKDVKTEQKYIRKFYREPTDHRPMILVNSMLYRFLQDVFLLHEPNPYKQVLGMFRKYLPMLVGKPSEELEQFLSLYTSPDMAADQRELTRALNLAFVSATFTLIHESVHLESELYQASEHLIRSSSYFSGLDDASIRELACDFSALYLMLSQDMPIRRVLCERMRLSAEELACCAFVALHAEFLYQLFQSCLHFGDRRFADMGELINLPLTTRIKNLCIAAKITCNTTPMILHIGPIDISASLNLYSKVVLNYLSGCTTACETLAELSKKSEESGIHLQIAHNASIPQESVWFRINS